MSLDSGRRLTRRKVILLSYITAYFLSFNVPEGSVLAQVPQGATPSANLGSIYRSGPSQLGPAPCRRAEFVVDRQLHWARIASRRGWHFASACATHVRRRDQSCHPKQPGNIAGRRTKTCGSRHGSTSAFGFVAKRKWSRVPGKPHSELDGALGFQPGIFPGIQTSFIGPFNNFDARATLVQNVLI